MRVCFENGFYSKTFSTVRRLKHLPHVKRFSTRILTPYGVLVYVYIHTVHRVFTDLHKGGPLVGNIGPHTNTPTSSVVVG